MVRKGEENGCGGEGKVNKQALALIYKHKTSVSYLIFGLSQTHTHTITHNDPGLAGTGLQLLGAA